MKNYITIAALLAAGTAFANAGVYTWTGSAGDGKWNTSGNWLLDGSAVHSYYPQSHSDDAVIGENKGVISWVPGTAYFGVSRSISVGSGSSILAEGSGSWDLSIKELELNGASTFVGIAGNALGLKSSFEVNFTGHQSESSHGCLDLSDVANGFWWNDYSITVNAEITINDSGVGEIELVKLKSVTNLVSGDILVSGLTKVNETDVNALGINQYSVVSSGTGLSIIYNAASVPEPSAFGLLAGLGALALVASRRRRK